MRWKIKKMDNGDIVLLNGKNIITTFKDNTMEGVHTWLTQNLQLKTITTKEERE